jgi:hypothetical protein
VGEATVGKLLEPIITTVSSLHFVVSDNRGKSGLLTYLQFMQHLSIINHVMRR